VQPDQLLILYVSTSHTAVSGAIVQEKETMKIDKKTAQHVPIYFVSEALEGSKKYYLDMEKMWYAVVISTQKLHHYFEAQEITP
jgi:hypothetical protein